MNILEAFTAISGFIDMVNNMGVLTDSELEEICEAESVLYEKVIKPYYDKKST